MSAEKAPGTPDAAPDPDPADPADTAETADTAGAVAAPAAAVEALSAAIRFERGNPTPADVAAVVTVLAAAASSAAAPDTTPRSHWGDPRERLRPLYFNGANAYTSQTPLFWTRGT